jgi:TonB family protein
VTVAVVIAPTGRVTDAKVIESSGYPRLDAASAEAALKSCFMPAVRNGVSVEERAKLIYTWRIRDR